VIYIDVDHPPLNIPARLYNYSVPPSGMCSDIETRDIVQIKCTFHLKSTKDYTQGDVKWIQDSARVYDSYCNAGETDRDDEEDSIHYGSDSAPISMVTGHITRCRHVYFSFVSFTYLLVTGVRLNHRAVSVPPTQKDRRQCFDEHLYILTHTSARDDVSSQMSNNIHTCVT